MKKKRSLKEEIEYLFGLYFGLKSGALYVSDKKFGDEKQVMEQLEDDITKDVIFLSRRRLGRIPKERDFKSICVWYRTKLM